jgi:hypothetical protein
MSEADRASNVSISDVSESFETDLNVDIVADDVILMHVDVSQTRHA